MTPVDQTDLDAPTISKDGRVVVTVPSGTKTAGFIGPVPERDAKGFISDRNSKSHKIQALDAYAFSTSAIESMEACDVEYVLVFESDTGDCYEWTFDALFYADEVPREYLASDADPQKYVPRESARAVWREHSPYRHDEPAQPDHADGFRRASDLE